MRVLVTGATGFTGGHLARHLTARGHVVRALVREPSRAAALAAAGIDVVHGDLADATTLPAALGGIEIVHNVAALYRQAGLPLADELTDWDMAYLTGLYRTAGEVKAALQKSAIGTFMRQTLEREAARPAP